MKRVAQTLGISRSNLHDRLNGSAKPRPRNERVGYHKAQDAVVLPRIQALVAKQPTFGYSRITALLNRPHTSLDGLTPFEFATKSNEDHTVNRANL